MGASEKGSTNCFFVPFLIESKATATAQAIDCVGP